MDWSLTFGRYTLDMRSGVLWLTRDGGEGMEVKPEDVDGLFHEHFEATF